MSNRSIVPDATLLKNRRTRIIATLGPASASKQQIDALFGAGVNVFRLNMSHGDHDFHARCHQDIRRISEDRGKPIGIMADLCGPKIRTGKFRNGQIQLSPGQSVTVTTRDVLGEEGLIPSQYAALASDVCSGERILLSDGALELRVQRISGTEIACAVVRGGTLGNHKGINLPGVNVSAASLTPKDREDLRFVCKLGVDFIALSFVRRAKEIDELAALISELGSRAWVIAKIEKPEALENIDAIMSVVDAIMVARGDLGVELLPEQVPIAQQELIRTAHNYCKPVIVATQMLESMIGNAQPTRAEVSDVATAVTLGADAVMLSGETAVGEFPLETVAIMDRICRCMEAHMWRSGLKSKEIENQAKPLLEGHAVANAVAGLSRDLLTRAIIVLSNSGFSATIMSSARPNSPVVAVTSAAESWKRMTLLWGVIPMFRKDAEERDPIEMTREICTQLGLAEKGQHVLLVRGFHSNPKFNNPTIAIVHV
ncbi:MAG: pyruvate kinase [Candidatus Eutrophobiaceae bacterium]